jgi:hypothetical protein
MPKGRPKLAEEERLVHVTLRVPRHIVDWYDNCVGGVANRSTLMRQALEEFAFPSDEGA